MENKEKIAITTDSTADLSPDILEKYGIAVFPLHVILGTDEYRDGVDITPQMIFDFVAKNKILPKTSAGSVDEYIEFFKKRLETADVVIHYDISADCSVSYNNAVAASEQFNGRVKVVDTRQLSTGQGLVVLRACDMVLAGKRVEEIVADSEEAKLRTQTSFVVDVVDYLYKGGRCTAAALVATKLLKIHPSITMVEGKLTPHKKYMGSLKRCIGKYVDDLAEEYPSYDDTRVFITHSCCEPEIVDCIKEKVAKEFKFKEIIETKAGSVVTSHCGQGTLGVLFITTK